MQKADKTWKDFALNINIFSLDFFFTSSSRPRLHGWAGTSAHREHTLMHLRVWENMFYML